MWYLVSSTGKRLYLKPNIEITFGRKKGDVLLPNDESVSRLHGSVCVTPKDLIQLCEPTSNCKLRDMGSKYGTFVFSEKEPVKISEDGCNLKDQDKIRFGLQGHIFTIMYVPIITAVSSLSDSDKHDIEELMDDIDGVISADWTVSCTHLTVSKATLTEKVILAMASAMPIVNMNYWKQVKCAIDNADTLPNIECFVPEINESLINKKNVSLLPNEERRTLFKDLIFVYFNASQYKMYGKMVNLAGGKSLLYANTQLTIKELCASNVVVLKYLNNHMTQSTFNIPPEYDKISKALLERKRKMISESEIPLAILYCSVEKYCNPRFKFEQLLKRKESTCPISKVLVADTQDEMSDIKMLPRVISDVRLKSNINIERIKQKHVIIPETYLEDTVELVANDASICHDALKTESTKTREKETKEAVIIPETNTSASSIAPESLARGFENLESQQLAIPEENLILKKPEIIVEETPPNNITEVNAHLESDTKNVDADQKLNWKFTQKEEGNSSQINRFLPTSPLRQIECSETEENFEKVKKGNKEREEMPERVTENRTTKKKKSTSSIEHDSDEELDKRVANCDISFKRQEDSNNFGEQSSAFLRLNVNHKKFKKVYNKIPKKRLKISDMYTWDGYDTKTVQ